VSRVGHNHKAPFSETLLPSHTNTSISCVTTPGARRSRMGYRRLYSTRKDRLAANKEGYNTDANPRRKGLGLNHHYVLCLPHPQPDTSLRIILEGSSQKSARRHAVCDPAAPSRSAHLGTRTPHCLVQGLSCTLGSDAEYVTAGRFSSRPRLSHLCAPIGNRVSAYSEGVRYDPSPTTYDGPAFTCTSRADSVTAADFPTAQGNCRFAGAAAIMHGLSYRGEVGRCRPTGIGCRVFCGPGCPGFLPLKFLQVEKIEALRGKTFDEVHGSVLDCRLGCMPPQRNGSQRELVEALRESEERFIGCSSLEIQSMPSS